MSNKPFVAPPPSATVILLRDAGDHLETLLLRRNSRLSFHGGAWVFPGGRIDPEDYPPGAESDVLAAAQHAAVRKRMKKPHSSLPPRISYSSRTGQRLKVGRNVSQLGSL